MLAKEQWMEIHVLKAQGLSLREIARRLGVSRNTVTRYLSAQDVPRYKGREARPTKLDPFQGYVIEPMQAAAPEWIAAPAMLRELKALGYTGQLRSVQAFMQAHKPTAAAYDPVVRFETAAGQQMQCDFVVFRCGVDPLYAFTATLGNSRWRWVRFATNERSETLVACHHALFESLGGVPREVLYDNAKTIVDKRDAYCQTLKLDGLMARYRALASEAADKDWSFLDFLEHTLAHERDTRQVRSRQTLVRMAAFPTIKTLDDYDYGFAVGAPKKAVDELASLRFIERGAARAFRRGQNAPRHRTGLCRNAGRHQDEVHYGRRPDDTVGSGKAAAAL